LSETNSLIESVDYLADAAKLCLDQGGLAQYDYVRASYRHRASLLINRGTKIKALRLNNWKPSGEKFDMASLELALAELESPHAGVEALLIEEPLNNRPISNSEHLVMLRASKIYGQIYKPWTKLPTPEDFAKTTILSDQTSLTIPSPFLNEFVGWLKPEKAFPTNQLFPESGGLEPTMKAEKPINLVQDAALDCSLVAGLCALVGRIQRGYPSVSSISLLFQ
jgi:calpain-7